MGFIHIKVIDIIDIVLVALLLYYVYKLMRGTRASSIIWGVFVIYLMWIVVKTLNMELLSSILGSIISVGFIALIVIFQPELRQFLQEIGDRTHNGSHSFWGKLFGQGKGTVATDEASMEQMVQACVEMSREMTGALIVLKRDGALNEIIETGVAVDSLISVPLIKNLFYKNSPLHDGAIVIDKGRIVAAKCVLPSTQTEVPLSFGMRHRAAVGMSEVSDAVVVVVSEQTGVISIARNGKISRNLTGEELKEAVSE